MARKKKKLYKEAMGEILVADTDTEAGSEASDFEDYFEEEEEEENSSSSKPQQKSKHRLQQVAASQPGDGLKEGTQIFILLSVQHKV